VDGNAEEEGSVVSVDGGGEGGSLVVARHRKCVFLCKTWGLCLRRHGWRFLHVDMEMIVQRYEC
jgi:hypothetical protein